MVIGQKEVVGHHVAGDRAFDALHLHQPERQEGHGQAVQGGQGDLWHAEMRAVAELIAAGGQHPIRHMPDPLPFRLRSGGDGHLLVMSLDPKHRH